MIGKSILHYHIMEKLGSAREIINLSKLKVITLPISHREMAKTRKI